MRAAEVTKLTLEDIDWGNGIIHVRGTKSRRDRKLSLARDVERALLVYLKRERPALPYRHDEHAQIRNQLQGHRRCAWSSIAAKHGHLHEARYAGALA
ncbi:hypothetical protein LMG29542_08043 [Paraburkholderia humisilvae]|uniref:Tyr recombinase domain-containing protein n=2 Tax=Paraburkholderia humisilvae TaxID=627669 RepID=A0A6J5FBR7_9BURK|nr:hypothetical protein LMG29542_08043 [Paraburkholderia humisilvae]